MVLYFVQSIQSMVILTAILRNDELQRSMNENWNYVAPITFLYDASNYPDLSEDTRDQISRQIRGFYFGQDKIGPERSTNLTNVYSDRHFNHGVTKTAILQAKYSPVYPYIFTYMGEYTYLQLYFGNIISEPIGVCHGECQKKFFFSVRKGQNALFLPCRR